jgi:hypothetical protein
VTEFLEAFAMHAAFTKVMRYCGSPIWRLGILAFILSDLHSGIARERYEVSMIYTPQR